MIIIIDRISRNILLLLFFFVSGQTIIAQGKPDEVAKNEQIVRKYFNWLDANGRKNFSLSDLMINAAFSLLNTPYVPAVLERNDEEKLVVNLQELDCMTFVENCLALSRSAQYSSPDYDYFVRELRKIRYRKGVIQGYTSRLHYTTDWLYDNAEKGIMEDITYALGGKKFKPQVSYMSSHPDLYPALKDNLPEVERMIEIENQINRRNSYYYIPRNEIQEKTALIKNGDIICFTTSLPGLDISHLGIAYWNK
ncbi:MAG: DUF1460 domain-containing protein, partial [Clostridiales bacterium]|nr:DUF1460 domain-containing protein [Clostridiales bacterium]